MSAISIQETASRRLYDIYCYTRDRRGEHQPEKYIIGLFDAFEEIATHYVVSKPVPAESGVEGFSFYVRGLWSIGAGHRMGTWRLLRFCMRGCIS